MFSHLDKNFLIDIVGGGGGVQLGPLGTTTTSRPIMPAPVDYDDWQGKLKYSEKTCPSAA
jgi:hypothetical protein